MVWSRWVGQMPLNTVHVLFCCDRGYAQHLCVAIISMLENNPASQFDIVVVTREDFGDTEQRVARSVARYRNFEMRFEVFSPPTDLKLPLQGHYSLDNYSRLWLADFFPASVDRVLYLDSDLIVVGDIQELWDIDLGGRLLAAASIPGSTKCGLLSIPECYGYFNSGVFVIDLRQWRETRAVDEVVAFVAANPDKLADVDQDVLNACFYNRRARLPYIWNVISPFYFAHHPLGLSQEEVETIRRDARIVHFNGASKPWSYMSKHPRRADYLGYLKLSEWRDYVPPDRTLLNMTKKQMARFLPRWLVRALRS